MISSTKMGLDSARKITKDHPYVTSKRQQIVPTRWGVQLTPECFFLLQLAIPNQVKNDSLAPIIEYIKKGIIKKNQNVIFIFTGGSPAVFAYNEELSKNNS